MGFDAGIAWRAASFLMLAWLAVFFGRTLRAGNEALITRIARVGEPDLPAHLVRYTRRLTAVWVAYFVLAAFAGLFARTLGPWTGLVVWAGTATLFVGEHKLRGLIFPGHPFPGLRQQLKDTLHVFRPARHAPAPTQP